MSKADQMGISPSQVSFHSKSPPPTEHAVLQQTHDHEFRAECKQQGLPVPKKQAKSEVVQTETEDASNDALPSAAREPTGPSCQEVKDGWHDQPERSCADDYRTPSPDQTWVNQSDYLHTNESDVVLSGCIIKGSSRELPQNVAKDSQTLQTSESDVVLSSCNVNGASRALPESIFKDPQADYMQVQAEDMGEGGQAGEHLQTSLGQTLEVTTTDGVCYKLSEAKEHMFVVPADKPEQLGPLCDGSDKQQHLEEPKTKPKNRAGNSRPRGRTKRAVKPSAKLSRKKYALRSSTGGHRVLRTRNRGKNKTRGSGDNSASASSTRYGKRKQKKKMKTSTNTSDEYSKIRRHLRYLLNRINYEQSLIVAYSAEGWKGLSLEKLKPEKELQRAKSEIFRRKLKIRDLFKRIDSLCAEGRLPEALFDSEGQIDSEDIFCAKCGSKDLTLENDIILCDGICDRGFHQFCLVPPLLKEEIPPDDEGWLCPGCDCKVDCIDLLNESQGTHLSVADSWEKVFPEAIAAGGGYLEQLPSDDSNDTSYDPNGPETDQESQGDESSSSDESNFTSTSEEMETQPDEVHNMGLPSDDSEDNDYDPDVPDYDESEKPESSSSDFTSDSEDLAVVLGDDKSSAQDDTAMSLGEPRSQGLKNCAFGANVDSINKELSSILVGLGPSEDGNGLVAARRKVERLDYKKLYDETYGNASSDSDDDEDFFESVGSGKRRKKEGEVLPSFGDGNTQILSEPENRPHKPWPELVCGVTSNNHARRMQTPKTCTAVTENSDGDGKKTRGRKRKTENQTPDPEVRPKPPETEMGHGRTRRKK